MGNNLLEDLLAEASFVRWIRNEADSKENRYWNSWLNENIEHRFVVVEARAMLAAFQREQASLPDIELEWQKLDNILLHEEQQMKIYPLKNGRHRFGNRLRGIVAIILVGICVGTLIFNHIQFQSNSEPDAITDEKIYHEYRTDYGEKVTFRLSDNSRIVLNANSHIRFLTERSGMLKTNEVWLEGEAYFDIMSYYDDQSRTFMVYTADGSVQVLGTRFVMKTMDGMTRAVLEEGEIQVKVFSDESGATIFQNASTTLKPGDMAHFASGSSKVQMSQVNPKVYTSWNEDIWFFDNTPVSEIADRIEEMYGLRVSVAYDLNERKLSGSIKSTNLKVVTKALSAILEAPVERTGQEIIIGGRTQSNRTVGLKTSHK